eukprot:206307-Chlamydomonas_euryale.AAC.4
MLLAQGWCPRMPRSHHHSPEHPSVWPWHWHILTAGCITPRPGMASTPRPPWVRAGPGAARHRR